MNSSAACRRIAEAIQALPREKRPYTIRDLSPGDVITDLAPFIEAEMLRAVEKERSEMRDACVDIARTEADTTEEGDMHYGGRVAYHIRNVIDAIKKLP